MKIAAFVLAKDEIDLIALTIEHLKLIGVDVIIACDVNSTDGTQDFLKAERSPNFHLLHVNDLEPGPIEFRRVFDEALAIARAEKAVWLLMQDADEFWLPATGHLKTSELSTSAGVGIVSVSRFNVPLARGVPPLSPPYGSSCYDQILLVVRAQPDFGSYLKKNPLMPWILGVPAPKAIVRPEYIEEIAQAGHDAVPRAGMPSLRAMATDIVIAHLPFTTEERFKRKVANIQRHIGVHYAFFNDTVGWHWTRWAKMRKQGILAAEFERSCFSSEAMANLRRDGTVISAKEKLESMAREAR